MDPLFRHRARLGIGAFFALRFLGLIVYSSAGRLSEAGADSLRLFEALVVLGTVAALLPAGAGTPQVAFRVGHADTLDAPTPRRPVADVLT